MTTVMIDLSGERCARSVHGLSTMSRSEVEEFLAATARASALVVVGRARPPKAKKVPRNRRGRGRL